MPYPRFSGNVVDVLNGLSLGAQVDHVGDMFHAPPYVTVAQSSGNLETAQVMLVIYGKDIDEAIRISDLIYDGMKKAKIQGKILSLNNISEGHVVNPASEAKVAVQMIYNIPVVLGYR